MGTANLPAFYFGTKREHSLKRTKREQKFIPSLILTTYGDSKSLIFGMALI